MSHEAETKKEATAAPETEQTVTPEAEPSMTTTASAANARLTRSSTTVCPTP